MELFLSIRITIVILTLLVNVHSEYNKLELSVLSSSGIEIQNVDVTPMPILNPGEAFLTFNAKFSAVSSSFC